MAKGVNDAELKRLYDLFNKKYFDDRLPEDIIVSWSKRMTSKAAVYRYKIERSGGEKKITPIEISLSVPYHIKYEDALENTLVHEMIHVKYPEEGHSDVFKKEMQRLNKEHGLSIQVYSLGAAKVNYIYTCVCCKNEYERTNTLRQLNKYMCKCGGSLEERKVECGGSLEERQVECSAIEEKVY